MILLKLGGSLITRKQEPFSFRHGVMRRLAREILPVAEREPLVVVHGGGSFGHPLALEYALHRGLSSEEQLRGIALTRQAMAELTRLVVGALVEAGVRAFGVQTSAIAVCRRGEPERLELGTVRWLLELGLVPVLCGDVARDAELGVCILSGDTLVRELALELRPRRIVLATDVDGIYSAEPESPGAELIPEVTPESFGRLAPEMRSHDATGGMRRKLEELVELARRGYTSVIINALEEGRLRKALSGEKVRGTIVKG